MESATPAFAPRKRILLVEDDSPYVQAFKEIIRGSFKDEYEVIVATSVEEGIAAVREHAAEVLAGQFNSAFIDGTLHGQSGALVYREMLEHWGDFARTRVAAWPSSIFLTKAAYQSMNIPTPPVFIDKDMYQQMIAWVREAE